MWNSLLSPLSRGQGKQNGALKVVDQSEECSVPSFLPSLVPPEKTVWNLPPRLARGDGEVVLPRTYLTRRGPLLLFTTPDLLMAEQQGLAGGTGGRLDGAEPGIALGTVDGLIESVLQFGLEEAGDEPKGKTFLRFLKGLDERSIDLRAQPGGDLGVYLRHLKSSASHPKYSRESDSSQSRLLFLGDTSRAMNGDLGPKARSRSYNSGLGAKNRLSSGQLLASLQSTSFYLGRPVSTAQAQNRVSSTSQYADDESDDGALITKGEFYELEREAQSDDSTSSSSLPASKSSSRGKKSGKKSRAGSLSSKSRSIPETPEQRLDPDVRPRISPQSLVVTPPPPSLMESSEKENDGNDQQGIGMKIHVELPRSDDESGQDDGRHGDIRSVSASTSSSRRQKRSSGLASGNGNDITNKTLCKGQASLNNDTGYETAEQQEGNEKLLNLEQNEYVLIEKKRLDDIGHSSLNSTDLDTVFQSGSVSAENTRQNDITDTVEGSEERFRENVEALRPLLPQYTADNLAKQTSFSLQSSLPDENTQVVLEPVEVAMLPHSPREVARSRSISQSTIRSIRSFLSGEADDESADDQDYERGNGPDTVGTSVEQTKISETTTDEQKGGPVTSSTEAEESTDMQYATETVDGAASNVPAVHPDIADTSKEAHVSTEPVQVSKPSVGYIDPAEKAAILAKLGFGAPTSNNKEDENKVEEPLKSSDRKSSLPKRESLLTITAQQSDSTPHEVQEKQDSISIKEKKDPISIPSAASGTLTEKPVTPQRKRLNSTERASLMAKLGMADDVSPEKDGASKEGEAKKSPGRKMSQVTKPGSKPGSRKAPRQKPPTKKKTNKVKDNSGKGVKNVQSEVVDSLDIAGVENEKDEQDGRLAEELVAVQKDLAEEKVEEDEKAETKEKDKAANDKETKKKRAQQLKKEQEELKQRLQEEKKRREEEQRLLKEKIREREEAQRREEEDRKRQIEDQKTAIEMAELDAEEASRMEEEARQALAESRKKAREEREARRKADQERRKEEAQRRREEQKQMQLEAQQREERMRRAIGDAEERRRLAEIERKRRDEEERMMEEEQRAEEERLRREAEAEEERIREAEKRAEEEAMRKLTRDRREAEERMRLAKEEAERKRRAEVKMKFLQELKEQEEAEKRRLADMEDQLRQEEERRRRIELEQLDAERREQARQEAEQAREEEARRREHNLDMRKNLTFVRHGQEFTKPWVWSYFKNVPMEVLREPYVKEDPKKNWKPKPKPKTPVPDA